MNVSALRRPSRHQFNIFAVIADFIKKNTVFSIALLLAAVTSVIVPPDAKYLSYIYTYIYVNKKSMSIIFYNFLFKNTINHEHLTM